ncbi:MAG: hypothetical protein ACXVX8_18155 [Blastococcus sp.]
MPPLVGRLGPAHAPALAWLADWLETAPVPTDGLRRVLVVGDQDSAALLAARLPSAQVIGAHIPLGDHFDLVAVLDAGMRAGPARLSAAAAAVRRGGTLLVLAHVRAATVDGPVPAGWDPAAAGLRLIAFDDLTDGSGGAGGRSSRWLRATYRRGSR